MGKGNKVKERTEEGGEGKTGGVCHTSHTNVKILPVSLTETADPHRHNPRQIWRRSPILQLIASRRKDASGIMNHVSRREVTASVRRRFAAEPPASPRRRDTAALTPVLPAPTDYETAWDIPRTEEDFDFVQTGSGLKTLHWRDLVCLQHGGGN